MNQTNKKRGQVTIFIILAIVIVVIVLIVFFLFRGPQDNNPSHASNFVSQLKKCSEDSIDQAIETVSRNGGSINPENSFMHKGEKIEYLCYTEEYHKKCVVQKPLLKKSVETEIENFVEPQINDCLNAITESFEKKGYKISHKIPEINVDIVDENIRLAIDLGLKVSKEETKQYDTVKINKKSEMYDLLMIATSIMTWETRFGDSETMNYMMYYPDLFLEKKVQGDGTTIYKLTNKKTEEMFQFASRSMVIAPGLTGQ